jgi:hypothetical protein
VQTPLCLVTIPLLTGAWRPSDQEQAKDREAFKNVPSFIQIFEKHEAVFNYDDEGNVLIPAYAEAVPLVKADRWMDAMANLQEADTHQLGGRDVHSDVWRFLGVLDDCSSFMGPDKSKRPVTRLSCKAALTGSELPTPCLRQRRGSALR